MPYFPLYVNHNIPSPSQINPLRVVKVFESSQMAKVALDDLLTKLKAEFEKRFPQAQALSW